MKKTKLLTFMLSLCLMLTATGCNGLNVNSSTNSDADVSTSSDIHLDNSDSSSITSDEPSNDSASGNNNNNNNGNNSENSENTENEEISLINVLMVNDNHGVLNEEEGGFDKIAAGINNYASFGEVIKIANGDMFQGTYVSSTLRGLPMLDALNAMDFDAFVIGNHEFDWGLDEMKKYKDGDLSNGEAEFPFLGANIYDKRTNQMVDWLEPYTVVDFGEVKVGIIGIIGEVESSILSANVADYDFVEASEIVEDLAVELRTEQECDVVLVASHGDDYSLNNTMLMYEGAARIDGIFTGHTHTPTMDEAMRADGTKVYILQNGGYGQSFASLALKFDENGNLQSTEGRLNYTSNYTSDGTLDTVLDKYAEYISIGSEVVLTAEEEMSRYDVGNYVAYSMYQKYGVDFAIINSGGVRASISAGEVTYADFFQVLPFENEVYIVTLSGAEINEYINSASVYWWGLYNLEDEQNYQLAIIDFVYLSDSFAAYRKDDYIDTNDLIRDVFIDFIKSAI